jgi:hypothetical protein
MSNASHVIEWLDENRRRAYPLTENANNPDTTWLLDAALITDELAAVTLNSIAVSGGVCTITTSIGAFTKNVPILTTTDVCLLGNGSKLVIGEAVNTIVDGTTYNYIGVTFEESVVTHYTRNWQGIESLSFIADDGSELGPYIGDVDFLGGYYTSIAAKNSSLIWKIGKNSGSPLGACESFVESQCGEQLSYINGISPIGNAFNITTGAGLSLTSSGNTLSFSVSFTEADLCKKIPQTP